jgi:hypothetical protein
MELLGTSCLTTQLQHAIRNPFSCSSTFDQSYFSMRVYDVLTLITLLKEEKYSNIRIVAESSAVPVALAAAAITKCAITVDVTNVSNKTCKTTVNYQALIMKIGGLPGLLALNANENNLFLNSNKYEKLLTKLNANTKAGKLKNFI